ncbi:MAG: hypothetical protein RLY20_2960 [Verrucomicrobiota bacterium]|jgi:hypothetical protein
MTTKDDGKKISEVWLPGEGNAYNTRLLSGTHGNLSLNASYHGDRDEFWIVVEKEGKETERINARMVTSIVWA